METNDMDDETARALLERYLAGECTPAEREQVEVWLAVDPERRAYLESLRTIGETWAEARPRFDSRAGWRRMTERLAPGGRPEEAARAALSRRSAEHRAPDFTGGLRTSPRRAVVRRWAAAGAVAAAAFAAVVVGAHKQSERAPQPAPKEYATAAGQQMLLTLPDGTRLRLAPESRLRMDGEYGRATRTVQLEGQAYFQVTHDDARPFLVRARNAVAWDLGTKFTVRAYAGESVRVAVEEGSVAIPRALAAPLAAGDLATVDSAGHGTVEHGADIGRYVAWTKGTLEFHDTPLTEAARDLGRWYGVDVRIADSGLTRRHITVTLAESSIDAALDLVAPAVGARYERQGSAVVLRSLGTPSRR
jgi:transmembrane sensor